MINVQNELIEKYLENKRKTLVSYAETIYKLFDFSSASLWSSEEEFKKLIYGIVGVYTTKYYLRDNNELNSLNTKNLGMKEFKLTLALAVISDYYGEKYEKIKKNDEKSLYNLTIVIYIISNIDKEISFYNEEGVTIKGIVSKLKNLIGDVVKDIDGNNPFILDILANKIKDFERKEIRFFEYLKSTDTYIRFYDYTDAYYVDYIHELSALESYETNDVNYVYDSNNIKEMYMPIVFDLTNITILKAYANNVSVPKFILPINSKYLYHKNSIEDIKKAFLNKQMKKKIVFSTTFNDYKQHYSRYLILRDLGFNLVLFLDENVIINDYSNIKYDFDFYVTEKFVENNPNFQNFIEKSKAKYKIIKETEAILEDELISVCLEEEKINGSV